MKIQVYREFVDDPQWLAVCDRTCRWSLRADRIRCLDAAVAHAKTHRITQPTTKEKS